MDYGIATPYGLMVPQGVAHLWMPVAAGGTGLTDNLIAFWPGDEASGNLLDAHTNSLDLTDTNGVTNATGHTYDTARQYTRADSEYHTRPGDDALLSAGDTDLTLAAWVRLDSKAANNDIALKWNPSNTNGEYALVQYNNYFVFWVNGPSGVSSVQATAYGVVPLNTWAFIVAWHDAVNNTINIQVDNGTTNSVGYTGGLHDIAEVFRIGWRTGGANQFDGRIGPVGFWKSAAGGGGVLTAAQRTYLWNMGAGLRYSQLNNPGELWYDPHDQSEFWSAWRAKGAATYAASLSDLTGNGNDLAEGVAPTWDTTNGWQPNGSSHYLNTGFVPDQDQSNSVIIALYKDSNSTGQLIGLWEQISGQNQILNLQTNNGANANQYYHWSPLSSSPQLSIPGFHTIGFAGAEGYADGAEEVTGMTAGTQQVTQPIYLMARNAYQIAAVDTYWSGGNVYAMVMHNGVWTAADISALHATMRETFS